MMLLFFLLSFSLNAQPWMPSWGYSYNTGCPVSSNDETKDREREVDSFSETEAKHDSWDDLYLCQYCDTEIIIDPYGSSEYED